MSNEHEPFSEREGIVPRKDYRFDVDQGTRNAIYNQIREFLDWPDPRDWNDPDGHLYVEAWHFVYQHHFWAEFCSEPVDAYKDSNFLRPMLISDAPWWRIFEFVEYILDRCTSIYEWDELGDIYSKERASSLTYGINNVLERSRIAYKISDKKFVPRFPELEQREVERACNTRFEGANQHIKKAQDCLAIYKNPDCVGAIRESIHAVESIAKEITGDSKATLGKLTERLNLHPAFQDGLNNLYGFTSDASGIRHASYSDKHPKPDQNTARFMLVLCSSFVNYIISQHPE